jgi:hypothetical protein
MLGLSRNPNGDRKEVYLANLPAKSPTYAHDLHRKCYRDSLSTSFAVIIAAMKGNNHV